MSDPSCDEDYIPYATCSDCGAEKILSFKIKPDYPKCDGFCDACGCAWIEGITVITAPKKVFDESYQPSMPWGLMIKPEQIPQENLVLIHSKKLDKKKDILDKSISEVFPSDYCECQECGYDHKYDQSVALRKHKSL